VDPKTKEDLWVLPMQGNGPPGPFLITDATETDGAFSPDRFVAYVSDERGTFEVYVAAFRLPAAPSGWCRRAAAMYGRFWVITEGCSIGSGVIWQEQDGQQQYSTRQPQECFDSAMSLEIRLRSFLATAGYFVS
jgi:hypothetical protein